MTRIRGLPVEVEKSHGRQKWSWHVSGILWEYLAVPEVKLYRAGVRVEGFPGEERLFCPDDVVLFSYGFEAGSLSTLDEEKE